MARRSPNIDSVTTIADDGSRNFLHPHDVKGNFTNARRAFALILIGIYFSLPFIPINGYPAVFLDVMNRRFHLFGLTFAAQDLWLAFFFISGLGFFLFFITSLLGRLWCGWACPHSVFLEQVYRPIERLFEGPAAQQKKLDQLPWTNGEKLAKRGSKILVFFLLSTVIAHFFLAYFLSIPQLWSWIAQGPVAHPQSFIFVTVSTAIIAFNFTWFREQLCIVICPYGRFQSALIDDDTMVIGYDETRGEPRGKSNKDPQKFGDCIACNRCVQVCPTGIDIRQGLQLECIGCANCIDACNEIMDHEGKPRGLVRYDSLNGLKGKKRQFIRPRLFLYAFLLLLGVGVMTFSFTKLRPANMQVMRMQGMPYYLTDDYLRNQFQVRVINKKTEPIQIGVSVDSDIQNMEITGLVGDITLAPETEDVRTLILLVPRGEWAGKFPATVNLAGISPNGNTFNISKDIEFLGPDPELLKRLDAQETQTNPSD